MKDFFKTIKRYKILFAIETMVIVAVSVFIIEKLYGNLLIPGPRFFLNKTGLAYGIWWISHCVSEALFFATTPVVLIFTLIRYIIYDNKHQKIINNSFPESNRKEYLIELFLGGIPIAVTTLFYEIVLYFFGHFNYTIAGVTVWDPYFTINISTLGLGILFLMLGTYAFLVFARKVSSSIGGMILLYVVSTFMTLFTYVEFIDPIFYGKNQNNAIIVIAQSLIYSIPFAASIVGLIITSKKRDIAKGGTYYFKPIQIAVSILSGAGFSTWMLGFFDSEKGGLNPLYITITIIISLLVTVCVFFLTKEKRMNYKLKQI